MTQDKAQLYDQAYYNVRAYEAENMQLYFAVLVRAIKQYLKPTLVLDIGCAKGFLVEALHKRGMDAYGIDISHHAVESCPASVKDCLVQGDAEAEEGLPFEDAKFDLITCLECLEHFERPSKVVAEMRRVLCAGGYVMASSPKITIWRCLYNLIIGQAEVHPSEFSKKQWISIFAQHSFKYVGDWAKLWGLESILHTLVMQKTHKMMPCHPIGKFMQRLGTVGRWLRVRLNVLVWRPEHMLFQKGDEQEPN